MGGQTSCFADGADADASAPDPDDSWAVQHWQNHLNQSIAETIKRFSDNNTESSSQLCFRALLQL
jgi:hypothetical protein